MEGMATENTDSLTSIGTGSSGTPTRMRLKKKSTLTKLKERKLREQGSLTSLQSLQEPSKIEASIKIQTETADTPNIYKSETSASNSGGNRVFSTKDPRDPVLVEKPKPRPRSKRQGSGDSEPLKHDERNDIIDSSSTLNQRLQHLTMAGPNGDFIDPSIYNSGLIPKPPDTPRSQSSNPRTPRGYISSEKGEKRIRDQRLSGEEYEVEAKRDRNGRIDGSDSRKSLAIDKEVHPNKIRGERKLWERSLRRRGSEESLGEIKSAHSGSAGRLSNGVGKPPLNNNHRNSNNNSNHSFGSETSYMHPACTDLSLPSSHSGSKYLKSVSKHNSESVHKSSDIHVSKPSEFSSTHEVSSLVLCPENHASGDSETGNKSTQVIFTSESPLKMRSITSPPSSSRLEPISPRPNPPPVEENISSLYLRTTFKVDRPSTGSGRGGVTNADKSDSGGAASHNGDRVSQQSFASGSVLPVITTKEARSRSYLEGSIGTGAPSMLGVEELDRYFPTRKVNVLVGTWNMNEQKDVAYPLDDFILPESCDYVQDIYAVGTQENDMNKKEWEIKIQETLGPSHVMYHSVSLGSLHLVVFIRRDLIWFCSSPEDDALSLRAVTMVKTKGAIGISLSLFGTSYLFINCHLTSDITAIFDCVFWCGDLNFRIERKRHAVEGKVSQITEEEIPNFETLLGGDQLLKYMTEGKIFHGFQEGRINFHPTFKFDINKDTYDSSQKNRVPSYTDRIMFRSKRKNDITCMKYDAVMAIKHSDHKPVYGQFETVIRAGTDNMVYAAGHFDRTVYMEANRRRAAKLPVKKKSNSKVCTIQ